MYLSRAVSKIKTVGETSGISARVQRSALGFSRHLCVVAVRKVGAYATEEWGEI